MGSTAQTSKAPSMFRQLVVWFQEATQLHSLGFMLIIGLTYFLQGFRNYAFGDGIIWFYSSNFGLDPGPTQYYMTAILVTWNIKMIYGLIFDNFPLWRRHDKSWMIVAGFISTFGFWGLGFPSLTSDPGSTCFFFFIALMGMAMSDVIADSMVVKRAKIAGESGGADLQSYCWILSSVGSIIGRPVAGYINHEDGSGSRNLLGTLYALTALFTAIASIFQQESPSSIKWSGSHFVKQLRRLGVAIFYNKQVLLPMTWIVFSAGIVPDVSAAMNFWKKDVIDIGADRQAYIDTIGDVFSIVGLLIYTRWFKKTFFRTIFFWTQLAAAVFAFSDIILVSRWNTSIGMSDQFFLIGSNTIMNTVMQLQGMPFLVMAAQLCPKDIEATFYAAMMSLANLGGGFSSVWGGVLMDFLHIVKIANDSATANATTAIHTTTTASSLLSNSSVTSILNNNTNTSSTPASPTPEMYDFTHLMLALWLRVGLIILGAFLVFPMIPYTNEIKANVDDGDGVTPINDGSDGYNQLSRDSVSLDHSPSPTSSPTLLLHSGTKRKSSDVIRREDGGSIQMSLFETSVRISGDRVSREHLRRRSGETFVETRSDETSVDDGDTASLLIK